MFSFLNKSMAEYNKKFFDFSINDINNNKIDLSTYKNNTILLVNVASNCGFTKQYTDLQNLYDTYKNNNFLVIAVPSNQFGGQEPGSNNEIKEFCETNFNITFPIMNKHDVKGENAHPIYLWAKENFGKSTIPKWNFHKILINKNGKIESVYGSFTNPMSKKITSSIEKIL
tara:strand:- start:42 stop:554 length:513 start_codon:yes stop_codon:yes gene_type:complete